MLAMQLQQHLLRPSPFDAPRHTSQVRVDAINGYVCENKEHAVRRALPRGEHTLDASTNCTDTLCVYKGVTGKGHVSATGRA